MKVRLHRCTLPLLVPVLLLAACGPTAPLKASLVGQPINVTYGRTTTAPAAPPQAPIPGAAIETTFPIPAPPPYVAPSVSVTFPATPTPAVPRCPAADPRTPAVTTATPTVAGPPAVGAVYAFRYAGTETVTPASGGLAQVTRIDGIGRRQVLSSHPESLAGTQGFNFTVGEDFNGTSTQTMYFVLPTSPAGDNGVTSAPAAGIYLESLAMTDRNGLQVFQPSPYVMLFPFPAVPAAPIAGSGTDAVHGVSETIVPKGTAPSLPTVNGVPTRPAPAAPVGSSILGETRVDACGIVLDSWQAELYGHFDTSFVAGGAAAKPAVQFDSLYDFGTEYGGLVLGEHRHEVGTQLDGSTVVYDVVATIDSAPKA